MLLNTFIASKKLSLTLCIFMLHLSISTSFAIEQYFHILSPCFAFYARLCRNINNCYTIHHESQIDARNTTCIWQTKSQNPADKNTKLWYSMYALRMLSRSRKPSSERISYWRGTPKNSLSCVFAGQNFCVRVSRHIVSFETVIMHLLRIVGKSYSP